MVQICCTMKIRAHLLFIRFALNCNFSVVIKSELVFVHPIDKTKSFLKKFFTCVIEAKDYSHQLLNVNHFDKVIQ